MRANTLRSYLTRSALVAARKRVLVAGSLLWSALIAGHAAEPTTPQAASAQLISARGEVIGAITARTTSFDGDANMVGAYGVLSARGYFADLLPSGALGQVLSLLYASADCSGAPSIQQASVVGGPLPVPSYVFAFGAPPEVFTVAAGASLRELVAGSERQRARVGFRRLCKRICHVKWPIDFQHTNRLCACLEF